MTTIAQGAVQYFFWVAKEGAVLAPSSCISSFTLARVDLWRGVRLLDVFVRLEPIGVWGGGIGGGECCEERTYDWTIWAKQATAFSYIKQYNNF